MSGWIKMHRSIIEHWIVEDEKYCRAWLMLLLKVNHEPKKVLIQGEIIECGRGQSLMSLAGWAKFFGKRWTIQRVRTFFDLLKKDKMIELEGLRKTTRLTVCNYASYQDLQQTNNRQVTSKQQASNKQVTTNKNDKEGIKNDKENKPVSELMEMFVENNFPVEFVGAWSEWKNYKQAEHKQKYKTRESEILAIKKLIEGSGGDLHTAERMLNNAMSNLYKGFFPLKDGNTQNGKPQPAYKHAIPVEQNQW